MRVIKFFIPKIASLIMILALIAINIQVSSSSPYVDVEVKSVQADPYYTDMELSNEICWTTGKEFLKCVHGNNICYPSDQGYCGEVD
jgi:uncharacterized protein YpmB